MSRSFFKAPAVLIANINTDIITLIVVFSAVFYFRNVAILILLILYLSYFVSVHNKILDFM